MRLNTSIAAGGVVYPAGTPATPELLERINAKHWTPEPGDDPLVDPLEVSHPNTLLLREVCEYIVECHLSDTEIPVGHLLADAAAFFELDQPEADAEPDSEEKPATEVANDPVTTVALEQPPGNATREIWAAYAKTRGATDAELEGLGQRDIRARWSAEGPV